MREMQNSKSPKIIQYCISRRIRQAGLLHRVNEPNEIVYISHEAGFQNN
jgi:hypothetical protein